MKKLNSTDIKGIIEEKGSNVISIVVEVPNDIFSQSFEKQEDLIKREVFGFKVDTKIVKSILFNGPSSKRHKMSIKTTLEFSNELLNEVAATEKKRKEAAENSVQLSKPMSPEEALEYAKKGVNAFALLVPAVVVRVGGIRLKHYIETNLIKGIEVMKSTLVSVDDDFTIVNDYHYRYVNVIIESFDMYIQQLNSMVHAEKIIYAKLSTDGTSRLLSPLDGKFFLEEATSEIAKGNFSEANRGVKLVELERKFLVELAYEELLTMGGDEVYDHYFNLLVSNEMVIEVSMDGINAMAVGFNPISNKIIAELTVYFTVEMNS